MPPTRATFLSWGKDSQVEDTRKFIEDAGVLLAVRDIGEKPLTIIELDRLLKHLDPRHFLNGISDAYTKNGLDKEMPQRHELLAMIAEDHTLLRRPIIYTERLLMVGNDRQGISQMLQISSNGTKHVETNFRPDRQPRRSGSGRSSGRSSRHGRQAAAASK